MHKVTYFAVSEPSSDGEDGGAEEGEGPGGEVCGAFVVNKNVEKKAKSRNRLRE